MSSRDITINDRLFFAGSTKINCLFTDTKNSVGLVGCIEEVAHNAIAVYWNPLDSPAKVGFTLNYTLFNGIKLLSL